ncbi:MAG: malto-oligosyltrehalose trehalohydrolase [Actinomycetota bacterium]
MERFRVWAPGASEMEVVVDGACHAMTGQPGGWWEARGEAGAGSRYTYRIDGGPDRPDPRSHSQPEGVHGPSCVVDHSNFAWTDAGWRGLEWPSAVLYELHIGTFSPEGTFDGAIDKLGHVVDLGVSGVEVMPVAQFSGTRGWGYDGVNLFAPHHSYGGPEGFKRFVDACHGAGLGVVLDVVYNHLGPEGNYLPEFGPYLTDHHATFWGGAVNFDGPGSAGVRRFVVDNALMWLGDYHCDALRLDAVHAIVDDSEVHILEELSAAVEQLASRTSRRLQLVAESDLNDPVFVEPRGAGGHGLDAVWADEWHHALHAVLTGETQGYYRDFGTLGPLAKALEQGWVHDGTWSDFRGRPHGKSPAGLEPSRLVVATQNHDQVGNRARGERSSALMDLGRLKAAAALLLTSQFVPLLFAGEEWGASTPFQYFTDHQDPELAKAVSLGRRREFASFGWEPEQIPDPQDPATFERSKLDWDEPRAGIHREMVQWYRELIALRRRAKPGVPRRIRCDQDKLWLAVESAELALVVNLASETVIVRLDSAERILSASDPDAVVNGSSVSVPPAAVAVVSVLEV